MLLITHHDDLAGAIDRDAVFVRYRVAALRTSARRGCAKCHGQGLRVRHGEPEHGDADHGAGALQEGSPGPLGASSAGGAAVAVVRHPMFGSAVPMNVVR